MVALDVPAMVHVSGSCNPNFHHTGAHYINGDTTAFMQFLTSDLFKDFPTLRFIIPHGGGAVKGVNPATGFNYDDTKRYIDSIEWLSAADREKIFHTNVCKVYGRYGARAAGRRA